MIRIEFPAGDTLFAEPIVMSFDGEVLEVFNNSGYDIRYSACWRCHIFFINKIDIQTDKKGYIKLRVLAEKEGNRLLYDQTIAPEFADRVNELVAAFQQAKAAHVANS